MQFDSAGFPVDVTVDLMWVELATAVDPSTDFIDPRGSQCPFLAGFVDGVDHPDPVLDKRALFSSNGIVHALRVLGFRS
ncbi:hypothetical protein [Nocardia xishanensis]